MKDIPNVICNIVLLNRINPAVSFITSEDVDAAVLEDNGRHGAPLLVERGNPFPPVKVDAVALAAIKDSVD